MAIHVCISTVSLAAALRFTLNSLALSVSHCDWLNFGSSYLLITVVGNVENLIATLLK